MEKNVQRLLRQEIRCSPALKKETKKFRKKSMAGVIQVFVLCLLPAGLLMALLMPFKNADEIQTQFFIVTFWATISVCWFVVSLANTLYRSPDLNALAFLPIDDSDIFQWQWRKFVRKTRFSILHYILAFALIAFFENLGWRSAPGVLVIALLQWLMILITAVLMLVYFPKFPYGLVMSTSIFSPFGFIFVKSYATPLLLAWTKKASALPYWIIPTG